MRVYIYIYIYHATIKCLCIYEKERVAIGSKDLVGSLENMRSCLIHIVVGQMVKLSAGEIRNLKINKVKSSFFENCNAGGIKGNIFVLCNLILVKE